MLSQGPIACKVTFSSKLPITAGQIAYKHHYSRDEPSTLLAQMATLVAIDNTNCRGTSKYSALKGLYQQIVRNIHSDSCKYVLED